MYSNELMPEAARKLIGEIFVDAMPFNQILGLKLIKLEDEKATISFTNQASLVGNAAQQILHGGVIASVLDVATGVLCVSHQLTQQPIGPEQLQQRLSRMGTIDLRIDYLRPGRGSEFVAQASLLRAGKKIAVARADLYNQDQLHIASATATYLVG